MLADRGLRKPRRSAALVKLSVSATAKKDRSWAGSNILKRVNSGPEYCANQKGSLRFAMLVIGAIRFHNCCWRHSVKRIPPKLPSEDYFWHPHRLSGNVSQPVIDSLSAPQPADTVTQPLAVVSEKLPWRIPSSP
jgi:hypothetical protein